LPFVALDVVLESDLNALENSDISCENNPWVLKSKFPVHACLNCSRFCISSGKRIVV